MPERYEMEEDEVLQNEMPDEMGEDELPDGPKPEESSDEMTDEEHDQYMRHCYSHPLASKYAKHCSKKYGMPPEDAAPPGPDPTDMPDADESEEPQMNMASASATNGSIPHKKSGKPSQHSRSDAERVREARRDAELEAMKKKVANAEARRWVTQLAAEGYDFDEDREVRQFARLDEEGRRKYADNVRRYYRKAPVGGVGPLLTGDDEDASESGEFPTSSRHFEKAIEYAREHPDTDWGECLRQTRVSKKNGGAK